jgi:hypothetical protein
LDVGGAIEEQFRFFSLEGSCIEAACGGGAGRLAADKEEVFAVRKEIGVAWVQPGLAWGSFAECLRLRDTYRDSVMLGVKTMVPLGLQLPPRPSVASPDDLKRDRHRRKLSV